MKVMKLNPPAVEEIFDLIMLEIATAKRMTFFRFHTETGKNRNPVNPV
jgi:hypothetical protein